MNQLEKNGFKEDGIYYRYKSDALERAKVLRQEGNYARVTVVTCYSTDLMLNNVRNTRYLVWYKKKEETK